MLVALARVHMQSASCALDLTPADRWECRQVLRGIPVASVSDLPQEEIKELAALCVYAVVEADPVRVEITTDLRVLYRRFRRAHHERLPTELPPRLRRHLAECLARWDRRYFIVVWETLVNRPLGEVVAALRTDPDMVFYRAEQLRRQGLNLSER